MKSLKIELSPEEVNKVLTALGNMPYVQVYELIDKMKQQAEEQLTGEINGKKKQTLEKEYVKN